MTVDPIEKATAKAQAFLKSKQGIATMKKLKTPVPVVSGFIIKNNLGDCSDTEIATILSNAEKHANGALLGEGDKFKVWCEKLGRDAPTDEVVLLMNQDPFTAQAKIVDDIPKFPGLYRSYCSYIAGKGRRRVR